MERDWDYTTEYCDGCAELGMTSCSCESDEYEEDPTCGNCGDVVYYGEDICDDCQEEEDNFLANDDED